MTQTMCSPALEPGRKRGNDVPRASIDQILEYSRDLSAADRALIEGVYVRGMRPAEFARAVGMESGAIRKRLERTVRRMSSPLFRFVVRHKNDWTEDRAAIADAVILRGLSQRSTAMMLGIGVHRVRREIDRIRALVDEFDAGRIDR
jgi:hypothetical protein